MLPPGTGGGGLVPVPECKGVEEVVGYLVDGSGMLVTTSTTAAVNVASVAACGGTVTCECSDCRQPAAAASVRVGLAAVAGAQQWTLLLQIPALPSSTLKVGDNLDLTLTASIDLAVNRTVD